MEYIKKNTWITAALCCALLFTARAFTAPPHDALVRGLDEALTAGDSERLKSLLSPSFRQHDQTDELFPKPIDRQLYIKLGRAKLETFRDFRRSSQVIASGPDSVSLLVTLSGVQRGMYLAQPPSGNHLSLEALEVWRIKEGRLQELWRESDGISALRQITGWQPPPDRPFSPVPARELLRFEPGVFLESITGDETGNLYFTKLMTGRVMRLAPDDTVDVFVDLPVGGTPGVPEGIMCLTPGDSGDLFASVIAPGSDSHGVWHIDAAGKATPFANLPDTVIPNGITRDEQGNLYVADAGQGGIWRIAADGSKADAWYTGELLQRRPYIGIYPPANGVQYWNGSLYVANSDRAHIVRIPVGRDGNAGPATVHARGVPGDDFAIDEEGVLYVTTHPFNSVLRVDREGQSRVIASPGQGVVGPTAAVFSSRGTGGGRKLYVVTDGGLYNPLPDQPLRPGVLELTPGAQ